MSSERESLTAVPDMPDGFTDQTAWDAIHWSFSENGSMLDQAVMCWQKENQSRCRAASRAAAGITGAGLPNPCIHTPSRCNGGGYDGCACGKYPS